ncbi:MULTISPECIES: hypothetical protein [unclassified Curtobacterium]|uniref:hypothetical protein n=1 Tax=unclassified Curtobacterium TaxID=257496 RepID=UPI000DA7E24B|nr:MULTISPECIES: hypothetical protein [unclassified Curtobacterium]PZE27319.1 hypothetical protein DEI86_07485 [Curtobacterium sp. MCBD17_028]PZE76201.1 hypothetical protein DEI82_06850 [Curtobacterium sp. MCBD17_019]
MSPDDLAQGLAQMASTGFELGGGADEVARDVRLMWEHLGAPAGAFEAAAEAVAKLPQRPEVPVADLARRAQMERAFGIQPVEVELAAALSARELLQRMARMRPAPDTR